MKKNILKSEGRISRWSRLKLLDDEEAKEEIKIQSQTVTSESHSSSLSNISDTKKQDGAASESSLLTDKGFVKPMMPLAESKLMPLSSDSDTNPSLPTTESPRHGGVTF